MKILGLILAAGYSSRIGSFKPLLQYEDKAFIIHIIEKLLSCCERVFIVVGFQKEQLIAHIEKFLEPHLNDRIVFIENKHFHDGMFSSIQAGLRAIEPELNDEDRVMLHLVDQPHIPEYVYKKLAECAESEDYEIVIPSYKKSAGHPIIFGKRIVEQILAAPPTHTLKDIIHKNKDRIHYLDVEAEQIIQNINTPKDRKEFLE